MEKFKKYPKKVVPPDFLNKESTCLLCGGTFRVTKRTTVFSGAYEGKECVLTRCPHCSKVNPLDVDVNQVFRAKLTSFIHSQVAPIKAIENENIKLPMMKLLDDFNRLVQED